LVNPVVASVCILIKLHKKSKGTYASIKYTADYAPKPIADATAVGATGCCSSAASPCASSATRR
jgi:hypothetical protein